MSELLNIDFLLGSANSSDFMKRGPFAAAVLDYDEDDSRQSIGLTSDLIARYGSVVLYAHVLEDRDLPSTRQRLRDLHETLKLFFAHTQLYEDENYAQLYGYGGDISVGVDEFVRQNIVRPDQAVEMIAYLESEPVRPHRGAQAIVAPAPKPGERQ